MLEVAAPDPDDDETFIIVGVRMLQRRGLKPQRRGFHPDRKERPSSGASRHLLPAERGEGRHPGGDPGSRR